MGWPWPNSQPYAHSLPSPTGWGEKRMRRDSWIEIMIFLLGKTKATCTSKAGRGIHSLLPAGRWMSCCFLENRTSAGIRVAVGDKTHDFKHPSFLLSLSMYCSVWCQMVRDIPFISQGQLFWLWALSASCTLPAYSPNERGSRDKALVLCSTVFNISVSYQHSFSYKCNMGCYEECKLHSHQTQYNHSKEALLTWSVHTADCNGAT